MGIFSRIATLFRIRANAALDKAEDPGQVMDYSYGKQLEQLQQLRRSIAEVVTNEKRLDLLQSQVQQQINKLDQQALQALQANREDLARMALQRKDWLVAQISGYEQQIAQLRAGEQQDSVGVIIPHRYPGGAHVGEKDLRPLGHAKYVGQQLRLGPDQLADGVAAVDRPGAVTKNPGAVDAVKQARNADRLRVAPLLQEIVGSAQMGIEVPARMTDLVGSDMLDQELAVLLVNHRSARS